MKMIIEYKILNNDIYIKKIIIIWKLILNVIKFIKY